MIEVATDESMPLRMGFYCQGGEEDGQSVSEVPDARVIFDLMTEVA